MQQFDSWYTKVCAGAAGVTKIALLLLLSLGLPLQGQASEPVAGVLQLGLVGQVSAVQTSEQLVTVNDRSYRLADKVRFAGASLRASEALALLREGDRVRLELAGAAASMPVIISIERLR